MIVKSPIEAIPTADSYAVSDSQRHLWVLSQLNSSISYNMNAYFELIGNYNVEDFCQSIFNVIKRHEILRTVFHINENGELRQWILNNFLLDFKTDIKDYRFEVDPVLQAQNYIELDSIAPFDLQKGPLIRSALLQISENCYVFYYNMHQIICDENSMEIFYRDVQLYYKADLERKKAILSPLNFHYKDYVSWQLTQLSKETYLTDRLYWLEQLSGNSQPLDFPSFKKRPALKTQRGRKLQCYFSSPNFLGLRNYEQRRGGDLFTSIITSLNASFYRYTGQNDITVSTLISIRQYIDLGNQIGLYTNKLALRNTVDDSDSFNILYDRVNDTLLNAYKHQNYPFERLVDELNICCNSDRSNIFDVMVVLQERAEGCFADLENPEKMNKVADLGSSVSQYDISLVFQEIGDMLSIVLEYNEDLYHKTVMEGFLENYCSLLNLMVNYPDLPLSGFDFLEGGQREELLMTFNNTISDYPVDCTVIDLFEKQVSKTPENIALVFEETEITYRELSNQSAQLADYLLANMQEGEEFVGIFLERSVSVYIAILGIIRAGKSYVPIDILMPFSRINYIIKDTNLKTVITSSDQLKYTFSNLLRINIDSLKNEFGLENIKSNISLSDDMYVIYTSGSTGYPKGVVIGHEQVSNLILNQIRYFNINETDSILQFSDISFDASVEQIFIALCTGAKLVGVSKAIILDTFKMEQMLKENKITHLHAVPQYLRSLNLRDNNHIRRVISGGDIFHADILNKMGLEFMYNEYGPTESTVTCMQTLFRKDSNINVAVIGYPISNTKVHILNNNLLLQPIGVKGEIYIEGVGLAKRYLNKPELTKEKFISNPFREEGLLYRTGDLGRRLIDGSVEFMGRIDDQIKLRGYRIELGEIEYHLLNHPLIREAVVRLCYTDYKEEELVAYLVCDKSIESIELINYLREFIPSYMIPGYYVELRSIPLNQNGKVNRKELPAPFSMGFSSITAYVSPRNETEQKLIEIWEKVLERKGIGAIDDFFELGGNNVKAIEAVHLINTVFTVKISIGLFFSNSALNSLSQLIQSLSGQTNFIESHGQKIIIL